MNKTSALILVLLSIGIFYTFTAPQYSDAQALASQSADYQSLLANVSTITEARDNLMNSFEAIPQTEKDRLMKALPDSIDSIAIARDLDGIAAKYGIALTSVSVEDKDPSAGSPVDLSGTSIPYATSFVSFSFVSDYENFLKFLDDIEKSLRIMDIKEASFQTAETGIYEYRVTAETYWLK
jgi:hypothetical protein